MNKDNHGYTIIEVLVAFVILTIVGTMVLGAMRSVASVMVDGSYIKNATNTAYEKLVGSELPLDVETYTTMQIHMNNTSPANILGIYAFSESDTTATGYEVALTKMEALPEVKWIPHNYTEVEVESEKARFKLLTDYKRIPMEPNFTLDIDGADDEIIYYYDDVEEIVDNAVRIDTPNEVNGVKDVSKYVVNPPSASNIAAALRKTDAYSWSSCSVVWAAIRVEENELNMSDEYVVYGYALPNVGKYVIFENELYELNKDFLNNKIESYRSYQLEFDGKVERAYGSELSNHFNKPNGVWYLY